MLERVPRTHRNSGRLSDRTVAELRRERILRAMVDIAAAEGFAGASVSSVCARANVSGRVFYETFSSREECFLAALDEGYRRTALLISQEFGATDCWLNGVRRTLASVLDFFDCEPAIAWVCVVESLTAGRWALIRRERHVTSIQRLVLGHWSRLAPEEAYRLASEGSLVSAIGIVQRHLLSGSSQPLTSLLGPLMGQITAPYLSPGVVGVEVERGAELAAELVATRGLHPSSDAGPAEAELPEPLRDPRAHRGRACVQYLAGRPGSSNRQIAKAVGIASDTQISTTLARLAAVGLLEKADSKLGGPNAWTLTSYGSAIAALLDG
jgi:AcrR family transcriptional regulator